MRVRFVQSGGLIGASRGCDLDTATLPMDEGRELASLVSESRLPASGVFLSGAARDLRSYEIHVESDAGSAAVTFDDDTLPDRARPLSEFSAEECEATGRGRSVKRALGVVALLALASGAALAQKTGALLHQTDSTRQARRGLTGSETREAAARG